MWTLSKFATSVLSCVRMQIGVEISNLIRQEDVVSRISDLLMIELQGKRLPTWNEVYNAINDIPSVEPERQKGKWIKVGHWGRSYKCNQCGNYLDFDGVNAGRGDANFCPNCGADMRGNNGKA